MSFNNSENSEHHIKMYANSTDHYHPLRSSPNKILFNKEKLNEGIRNMESITMLPVKEKIYYNPKFLINHVKTAASAYINNANSISENKSDTKIHINRNYLANLNLSNYTSSNDVKANVKPQSRGGIYINPKFINRNLVKDESNLSGAISNLSDNNDIFNSNILMIKNSDLKKAIPEKNNFKTSPSSKSKYKFIKSVSSPKSNYKLIKTIANPPKCQSSPKPLCIKTKYSLKRLNVAKSFNKDSPTLKSALLAKIKTAKTIPELNKLNKTKLVRKASSEFKKLSSTKLVRKSVLQSLILARRHYRNKLFRKFTYNLNKRLPKKKSSNLSYFPKIKNQKYEIYKKDNTIREKYQKINNIMNLKNENICNSSFKKIGKMKIVRKSLLKAQIEARSQVKNQYLRDYRNWMEFYSRKYTKFNTRNDIRMKFIDKQKALLKWRKKKQAPDTSRVKCKRTSGHAQTSKHLRKNNQPCPFYNRFGRCKGKDKGTCPKLHDSLYISICRKLLHGECNTKDCLLSHDIRPGKMPTCHHYLAGLCTRPNCPFLHIKVNPKAPICAAFLQGFCPDVFNCLKRHEFICPIFAEKGNCPRGKSCTYPHRSPVVHSKLLKDDQKPLIKRTTDSLINTNNVSNTKEVSDSSKKINSKNNQTDEKNLNKKFKKEYVKEAFTRYFAVSNSDATLDNSVDDIDSKENISSQKQNSEESS